MSEVMEKNIPTAEELFERVRSNTANVSLKPWEDWGISKEEWVKYVQDRIRRDQGTPREGTPAPDFTVERLDPKGQRTGEMFTLSSLFGKPIALLFGSYT